MAFRLDSSGRAGFSKINLDNAQLRSAKALEKLSSGMRINRGSDDPASLMQSEKLRAQIAGIRQAIRNSESSISVMQITDSSLQEVNNILLSMRQIAVAAASDDNTDKVVNQVQMKELKNTLNTITRGTKFGSNQLLGGGKFGLSGIASGDLLHFISGSEATKSSPVEGYSVVVSDAATASYLGGSTEVEDALEDAQDDYDLPPVTVVVTQDGKTYKYTADREETTDQFIAGLQRELDSNGFSLNVELQKDKLALTSKKLGSKETFSATSSVEGLISEDAMKFQKAISGTDIVGSINGEVAQGDGTILRGRPNNPKTADIVVSYNGSQDDIDDLDTDEVGYVYVRNNSMNFQIGSDAGNVARLSIPTIDTEHIGVGTFNYSGFGSLDDVVLNTRDQARDAIAVIDRATQQVSLTRGKIGSMQKNTLERNLAVLRVTKENLSSAESTLRDADIATQLSELTKNNIVAEGAAKAITFSTHQQQRTMNLLLDSLE